MNCFFSPSLEQSVSATSTTILEVEDIRSPGSSTGSSIRSNHVSSSDIEDASHTSWRIGMPWCQSPSSRSNNGSPTRNSTGAALSASVSATAAVANNTSFMSANIDENRYYGGIMKSTGSGHQSNGGMRSNGLSFVSSTTTMTPSTTARGQQKQQGKCPSTDAVTGFDRTNRNGPLRTPRTGPPVLFVVASPNASDAWWNFP
jgi:hypothetical protein